MPPLRIRKPLTPPVPHHHHHHGVPQRPRQGTRSLERIGGLPLQEGRRPLEEWEKVVSVKKFCWELLCGSFSSGPPPSLHSCPKPQPLGVGSLRMPAKMSRPCDQEGPVPRTLHGHTYFQLVQPQ